MEHKRYKIGIWFGGCSSEYEISLQSAAAVITHLNKEKYEPVFIGIHRNGNWFLYNGDIENIETDHWYDSSNCYPVVVPPDRELHGLWVVREDGIEKISLDAALPVLHGKNGEDGTIQGVLELAGIRLIGCNTLSSAVCMEKDMAHRLAQAAGVKVPKSYLFAEAEVSKELKEWRENKTDSHKADLVAAEMIRNKQLKNNSINDRKEETKEAGREGNRELEIEDRKEGREEIGNVDRQKYGQEEKIKNVEKETSKNVEKKISKREKEYRYQIEDITREVKKEDGGNFGKIAAWAEELGYPLFVKPLRAGSSFGITQVTEPGQLYKAVDLAFTYDTQCIMEEAIQGFEVGCAVMGISSNHPQGLVIGEVDEIELSDGFFDYTEKYTLKTSNIYVPARISEEKAEEIKKTAAILYRTLGCEYFARVDMFLTPEGEIYFNEVNTIPGFTSHSRYPNMMKAAGISFDELLETLLGLEFD